MFILGNKHSQCINNCELWYSKVEKIFFLCYDIFGRSKYTLKILEKKIKYHDQKKMVLTFFSCIIGLYTGSLV